MPTSNDLSYSGISYGDAWAQSAELKLSSRFQPSPDQQKAIDKLIDGLQTEKSDQVLLGVTGSGKTFTMAKVIAEANRTTLVLSPNKTLAAQLYQEFRNFFPENAVEYFVSYYDYYQPVQDLPSFDLFSFTQHQKHPVIGFRGSQAVDTADTGHHDAITAFEE